MKLAGAEARRYFAKPDPKRPAVLIYGTDPMRVALRRQELIAALIGPDGPSEMRLTRMAAAIECDCTKVCERRAREGRVCATALIRKRLREI